jgi:hypothetical protein
MRLQERPLDRRCLLPLLLLALLLALPLQPAQHRPQLRQRLVQAPAEKGDGVRRRRQLRAVRDEHARR